jgi:2-aminoadipate transaminase
LNYRFTHPMLPSFQFADRIAPLHPSPIHELFKVLGDSRFISFAGGVPDSDLFDVQGIAEATAQALAEEARSSLQYGAAEGYEPLREQLAQMLREKKADVVAADLMVTAGSQQALDLIGKTLISPGDKIIVEGPTFSATIACFRLYGAELISAPTDEDGVDVDRLQELVAQHCPKLVCLIPTFSNPGGATLTLQRRLQVLEMAVRHRVMVIEDDPYSDLYFHGAPPPSLLALSQQVAGSRDWLIYCGTLSKVLCPGLRVGWMVAPRAILAKAAMCKQFSDMHTSALSQVAVARYLQMQRLPALLARTRSIYAERAHAMHAALTRQLGGAVVCAMPQGGMFIWARLTGAGRFAGDGGAFAKAALESKVAVVPGAMFFANNPDHATLRLSYATSSIERIEEGVARMASVF